MAAGRRHVPDTGFINRYIKDFTDISGGFRPTRAEGELVTGDDEPVTGDEKLIYHQEAVFELVLLDIAVHDGQVVYPVE